MFLNSPWETLPVLHSVGSRWGVLKNRTEISCQVNLKWADQGTWRRKAILRSEDLVWNLPHKQLETGWRGTLEGMDLRSDQSGKTWLWCHSGLIAPGNCRFWKQLLPSLLLWQLSQPSRKKFAEGAPVLCGRLLSYVGPEDSGQVEQEHMGNLSTSGMGDSILHN
jgi:hypothetical protein